MAEGLLKSQNGSDYFIIRNKMAALCSMIETKLNEVTQLNTERRCFCCCCFSATISEQSGGLGSGVITKHSEISSFPYPVRRKGKRRAGEAPRLT